MISSDQLGPVLVGNDVRRAQLRAQRTPILRMRETTLLFTNLKIYFSLGTPRLVREESELATPVCRFLGLGIGVPVPMGSVAELVEPFRRAGRVRKNLLRRGGGLRHGGTQLENR